MDPKNLLEKALLCASSKVLLSLRLVERMHNPILSPRKRKGKGKWRKIEPTDAKGRAAKA
ncbi:MAG: hypothetical protein ISN28_02055 [Ectothiorhodospiraceae bacterium AqS1]|nr:hypothetical protein [Ectothiorhodospiraceae bacterium AqS1]